MKRRKGEKETRGRLLELENKLDMEVRGCWLGLSHPERSWNTKNARPWPPFLQVLFAARQPWPTRYYFPLGPRAGLFTIYCGSSGFSGLKFLSCGTNPWCVWYLSGPSAPLLADRQARRTNTNTRLVWPAALRTMKFFVSDPRILCLLLWDCGIFGAISNRLSY